MYVYVWHAITGYWGGVTESGQVLLEWSTMNQRCSTLCYRLEFRKTNPVLGGGCNHLILQFLTHSYSCCSSKRSAVVRVSDNFWPRDPASHTIHIASVAYNTVFVGEFMQPNSYQKMAAKLV